MAKSVADVVAASAARTATLFGPRAMRTIARFNKHVTNRVQRAWAPRLRHAAVIEHVGRKSGRCFQTPVMAFVEDGTVTVVLNYGVNSDWVRNVRAAGSAVVVHRGNRFRLSDPRLVSTGSADVPPAVRTGTATTRSALVATLSPMEDSGTDG